MLAPTPSLNNTTLNSPKPQIINRQQPPLWVKKNCSLAGQRVQRQQCVCGFHTFAAKSASFSLSLASSAPQGCNHFLSGGRFSGTKDTLACVLCCSATTHSSEKLTSWETCNVHMFIYHHQTRDAYFIPKYLPKIPFILFSLYRYTIKQTFDVFGLSFDL